MEVLPKHTDFEPLMTLYLTDKTAPEEVQAAKDAGVVAFKLYPAGATTNSDSGVTNVNRCLPTLNAMAEVSPSALANSGFILRSHCSSFVSETCVILVNIHCTICGASRGSGCNLRERPKYLTGFQ